MIKHIELIIDYIVTEDGDFHYNDNIGRIVRCKDCKWFQPINNGDHGYCGTPFHGAEVYEDDYCSDGEMRTDDEC